MILSSYDQMPLGPHRGKSMDEVPLDFWKWFWFAQKKSDRDPTPVQEDVMDYIRSNFSPDEWEEG